METEITTTVTVLLSVVSVMLALKSLATMMPELVASLHRTKACMEIEYSRKSQVTRNRLCLAMVLPTATVIWHFKLYDPDFFGYLGPALRLAATIAVIFVFRGMRIAACKMPKVKMSDEVYEAGCNFELTAFILDGLVLMLTALVLAFCGASETLSRTVLLWTLGGLYVLFLIRKTQIFASGCPLYSAILYLCALEVLPTGLLVTSALLL